eukprot:g29046.t1
MFGTTGDGRDIKRVFCICVYMEEDMEDRERSEVNSGILKNVHITEEEVLDALKRIKVDKSPGPDQVHPEALWEAREGIAGPIALIFVSSIAT